MLDQEILADYGDGIKGKLYKRFEFNSVFRYIIKNQIDLVYIRSDHNANPFTIRLVRKIKKAGASAYTNAPVFHKVADELSINSTAWVVHHLFNL